VHMLRPLLVLVALMLVLPATAQARAPWTAPDVPVHWVPCPEGGVIGGIQVGGCYANGVIYVDPATPDPMFALWHERGHVIDAQRLSPGERNRFRNLVMRAQDTTGAFASMPWLARQAGEAPQASPGEFFADAYATCSLRQLPNSGDFSIGYGYMPSTNESAQAICSFISRASSSSSRPTPGTAARQPRRTQRSQSRPAQKTQRAASRAYRRAALSSEVRALRYARRARR
jgi:hypothetical protein